MHRDFIQKFLFIGFVFMHEILFLMLTCFKYILSSIFIILIAFKFITDKNNGKTEVPVSDNRTLF